VSQTTEQVAQETEPVSQTEQEQPQSEPVELQTQPPEQGIAGDRTELLLNNILRQLKRMQLLFWFAC
jgi:hypothetical protein